MGSASLRLDVFNTIPLDINDIRTLKKGDPNSHDCYNSPMAQESSGQIRSGGKPLPASHLSGTLNKKCVRVT
jgi:hypothetical protein